MAQYAAFWPEMKVRSRVDYSGDRCSSPSIPYLRSWPQLRPTLPFPPLHRPTAADGGLGSQPIGVPVLAITGAEDGCMDSKLYDVVMPPGSSNPLFPRGLEVVRVPEAGHFVHQEQPVEVNWRALEWMGRWGNGEREEGS